MTKADNILKLAHAYAIKGEYEPFRAAVELLAADAARADELQLVANLLNEYGLQALDVVAAFKTAPPRTALSEQDANDLALEVVKGGKSVQWLIRKVEAFHGITAEGKP